MHFRGTRTGCAAEPFDVPDGGGFVGMRRDRTGLTVVLSAAPPPPCPVVLPDGPRTRLPLTELARCFDYDDARPTRIDIVTRTLVTWGDSRAARAYRTLLGPLAPASHRSTALVVHVDPDRCPDAVAIRGGGSVGALRTALWCVRRVIAAAAPHTRLRPLTAAELSADAAWTLHDDSVTATITATGIDGTSPPIGGDGQVIGAADHGSPVCLRIAGPRVERVDVAADPRVVRQTVVRLAAVGVRGHVLTDRPGEWSPLVRAVADPLLLGMGSTVPPTAQVLICDDAEPVARAQPGLTVLQIHRRDRTEPTGDFLLRQDVGDASLLHLVPPCGPPTTVRTVTTAAERELTG
ncbi:hypothetical protein GCM10023197_35210 [Gordonia humi]